MENLNRFLNIHIFEIPQPQWDELRSERKNLVNGNNAFGGIMGNQERRIQ